MEQDLKGRPINQSGGQGSLSGKATAFNLLLTLQLAFAECAGLTCAIPFRAVGLATGLAPLSEGREITSTRKDHLHGIVDFAFLKNAGVPKPTLGGIPISNTLGKSNPWS